MGSVDLQGRPTGVATGGGYAYVTTAFAGLQILDVTDPLLPQTVAGVDTPDYLLSVTLAEPYAYVGVGFAYGYSGLLVIDVSDPATPGLVSSTATPSIAYDVAVAGNHAYVASAVAGLQVIDIASPAAPQIVGSLSTPDVALAVAVSGELAYVTGYTSLQVVDISVPWSPRTVGSVATPGSGNDIFPAGGVVYVAAGNSLQVIDVSNPGAPRLVGSAPSLDNAVGLSVAENLVYVADRRGGLQILPAHCEQPVPVLVSGFTALPRKRAVLLSWFTSFESMHDGFNVYRSGLLKSGYTRLNSRLIRGSSPYSYLDPSVRPAATYYYKLGAVSLDGRETMHDPTSVTTPAWGIRTRLAFASPSPFRNETVLSFTLAAPTQATLAVYDVAGRLLRVVVDEPLPEGDHSAAWDGRDDAGLRVAGGTYFARLNADGETTTRKVVYLGSR